MKSTREAEPCLSWCVSACVQSNHRLDRNPISDSEDEAIMSHRNAIQSGLIPALGRREILKSASAGFGYLALAGLMGQGREKRATAADSASSAIPGPLVPKRPHFPVKAKRVIFLFMNGAMSQMDTFEYKEKLQNDGGKFGPGGDTLLASRYKFSKYGESGTWVSELYPNVAKHVTNYASSVACTPTLPPTLKP
jgi:hypothetical protein